MAMIKTDKVRTVLEKYNIFIYISERQNLHCDQDQSSMGKCGSEKRGNVQSESESPRVISPYNGWPKSRLVYR